MADHYIDFSASFNGNGSAANQAASGGAAGAFNTIVGITYTSGDSYWIRRSGTKTITAAFAQSVQVQMIAWPMSGDTYFSSRPASGTSNGWDTDVQTYAQIACATNSLGASVFKNSIAGGIYERIKVSYTAATQTAAVGIFETSESCSVNNCYFVNSYAGSNSVYGFWVSFGNRVVKLTNTTAELSGNVSGTNLKAAIYVQLGSDVEAINCVFTWSGTPTATAGIRCMNSAGTATLSFTDCTFNRNGTTPTETCVDIGSISSIAMYNCTITDNSTAASTVLDTGTAGSCNIQRLNVPKGRRLVVNNAGHFVHCSTFNQTVASSDFAVVLDAGCFFSCNNFTEFTGNTSGAIKGTLPCHIYLQNATFISANPFGSTVLASIWEADIGGTVNAWRFTGSRGAVTSEAVVRAGGEAFALKFNMSSGSQNFLGMLQAMLNGLETIYAPLQLGSTKITIYGAHKGYSPAPTQADIWADCDYLDSGSGAHRAFASSRDFTAPALASDSSVWSGDTGLTPFKFVITLAPGQACAAPIRIFDNIRQASAYFYIDPRPVIG